MLTRQNVKCQSGVETETDTDRHPHCRPSPPLGRGTYLLWNAAKETYRTELAQKRKRIFFAYGGKAWLLWLKLPPVADYVTGI